jgi:L-galactono-1,4-lactone dehydrogenase
MHASLLQDWVSKVNSAEALYWSRSSGVRSGWSDEILGFDCGGQQWVMEVSERREEKQGPQRLRGGPDGGV